MARKLIEISSTFFYIGYMPVAPGSMASIAGGLLSIALSNFTNAYIFAIVITSLIGFCVAGSMEKIAEKKDASCIVIDEVAGVLIAFFLLPIRFDVLITAYFLFRAFDMFKIYPANKFEVLKGSVGVMTDDLVAGIYTNLIMQVAIRLAGIV